MSFSRLNRKFLFLFPFFFFLVSCPILNPLRMAKAASFSLPAFKETPYFTLMEDKIIVCDSYGKNSKLYTQTGKYLGRFIPAQEDTISYNDFYLIKYLPKKKQVVFCYGVHESLFFYNKEGKFLYKEPYAFKYALYRDIDEWNGKNVYDISFYCNEKIIAPSVKICREGFAGSILPLRELDLDSVYSFNTAQGFGLMMAVNVKDELFILQPDSVYCQVDIFNRNGVCSSFTFQKDPARNISYPFLAGEGYIIVLTVDKYLENPVYSVYGTQGYLLGTLNSEAGLGDGLIQLVGNKLYYLNNTKKRCKITSYLIDVVKDDRSLFRPCLSELN